MRRDMWKVLCALYLGCAGTSSHKQVIIKSSLSLPSLFPSFIILFSFLLHPVLPQSVSSREPLCSSFLLISNQGYVSVSVEVTESHRKSLFVELVLVYHILFLPTFGLSENCQIGFLIYVASKIPGVHLRGYEIIGDCEATSFLFFFFFSQMHWNQSMPSFAERLVHVSSRAYLQDYVIGASMIMVALYFTCQESLAFVGCNQFRWTTTVVWSSHRVIAQCTVDWGINISPWMAMANRLWTAAHVAVRRLWTPRSTTAFSECMWVWASARYFLHFPSIQVSTYYIFNVYTYTLSYTWDLMYPREAFPVFCNTSCSHRLAGP